MKKVILITSIGVVLIVIIITFIVYPYLKDNTGTIVFQCTYKTPAGVMYGPEWQSARILLTLSNSINDKLLSFRCQDGHEDTELLGFLLFQGVDKGPIFKPLDKYYNNP